MKDLATIQKISNVRPHTNADNLELADVLGWQVVVKKGEFLAGDLAVYIVVDTVLPEQPEFEFLRNKHFRIKPIRLRSEPSAGILFPLSIIPNYDSATMTEGTDVTDSLKVIHYEKPMSAELSGQAHGHIPGFLRITDEDNLRSYPNAVPELYSRPYYISIKSDGSSGTFFIKSGEFGVCSRRIHLKESDSNSFWKIAYKYNIKSILESEFPNQNIAIQGELVGEGIQKNPLSIKGTDLHLFNLFDIDTRSFLPYTTLVSFVKKYSIPMVKVIDEGNMFHYTLPELLELANKQRYDNGAFAEGIVIRPQEAFYSPTLKTTWSGKVLNENYKDKE